MVSAATPSAAGGADRKTYKASASSAGSAATARLAGLELVDYLTGTYHDRIIGSALKNETVTVTVPNTASGESTTTTCTSAFVRFYGVGPDWANDSRLKDGRLMLGCTYPDGTRHRFYWGMEHLGDYTFDDVTNCLQVSRTHTTASTTFEAIADESCTAQDEIVDKASRTVSSRPGLPMPFRVTFTVSGAVPVQP